MYVPVQFQHEAEEPNIRGSVRGRIHEAAPFGGVEAFTARNIGI